MKTLPQRIGIVGGGPAGLFIYKRLVESAITNLHITIFENKKQLGAGMPYSNEGAGMEHVTNVSDTEVPGLVTSVQTWLQTAPAHLYEPFGIDPKRFNEYKVMPRLLFGHYLSAQFNLLHKAADKKGVITLVKSETHVMDVLDEPAKNTVKVITQHGDDYLFDKVILCMGHYWPTKNEGKVTGWFDSPYPPQKLAQQVNYPVAIKGASLSAVDAVRTLARANGTFTKHPDGAMQYQLLPQSEGFKLVLHSIDGLLPALRFHVSDPLMPQEYTISDTDIERLKKDNGGFVPLDYLFEHSFKNPIRRQQPELYQRIQHMNLEQYVNHMMQLRENIDPLLLFKAEYTEAEKSINRKQPVYWKEMLAVLNYSMNYPAKHFSAEDMLRVNKVLMPLISIVIAFVPQSSYHEVIALHNAGILSVVAVDHDSTVVPLPKGGALYTHTNKAGQPVKTVYLMFIDATGQPAFRYPQFPFRSLVDQGAISGAYVTFASAEAGKAALEKGNAFVFTDNQENYFLQLPGIQINDHFQVVDKYGVANKRIYIMAVPYIAGLNPDFSGLDFCEESSTRIARNMQFSQSHTTPGAA